ncbi:helix-turn-helix domain-containing protein [Robiginitalea sediminis]|uniref:helix-turn-helix domain-containing protein n=1 Tax=Robiginitalea sediminis TaxID=1982593 RepID=UPI000B4BECC7|nr:AraC family transcriptional regulator [Robiginitalea sediminis]
MSLYTTPLQIGYFFGLLMWLVFLVRGFRQQRLSDTFLGWIMFILAMELQDYTFGFAGINFLWNELNGFPRGVSFLFGPMVYFYFRAQTNRSFRLRGKDFWHALPYLVYFLYEITAFVQGPEAVRLKQESGYDLVLSYVFRFALWGSFIFYLGKCLVIYRAYRAWSIHQFSNTELISFNWFRNFIYAMIFWLLFREIMNVLDAFLDLSFYQDWWWNLGLVAVIFYIGLAGISQRQPAMIHFDLDLQQPEPPDEKGADTTHLAIAQRLRALMEQDRLYLQADLNLSELAQHLGATRPQVSAAINQVFGKNFNDYVNSLRIEEFIRLHRENGSTYTLLYLAYESGFNSKATFNRAFKKIKGRSPKAFLEG